MIQLTRWSLAIAGIAFAASHALAQAPGAATSGAAPSAKTAAPKARVALSAADYVAKAAASDLFEIQSSQTALQKTKSPEVRSFAEMMVEHHTATSKDLKAAAKTGGLAPPPATLPADKASKLTALRNAPVGDFDAMYMREQVAGHEEALTLHQGYAANGDNATLKAAAAKTAPIVKTHLDRARSLTGNTGR
jgi:putative membrane protein